MRGLVLIALVCCAMALILHSSKAEDMKQNNAIPHKIGRAKEVKHEDDYSGTSKGMGGMGGSMDIGRAQRDGQPVGNGYNVDVNGMHGVGGDGMRMGMDGQRVGNRNGGNGNGMGVPAGSATTKH